MNERINESHSNAIARQERTKTNSLFFFHSTSRTDDDFFSSTRFACVPFLPHWSGKPTEFFGLNWEMTEKKKTKRNICRIRIQWRHFSMLLSLPLEAWSGCDAEPSKYNVKYIDSVIRCPTIHIRMVDSEYFVVAADADVNITVVQRPATSAERVPDARSCAHRNSFHMENGDSASLRVH